MDIIRLDDMPGDTDDDKLDAALLKLAVARRRATIDLGGRNRTFRRSHAAPPRGTVISGGRGRLPTRLRPSWAWILDLPGWRP